MINSAINDWTNIPIVLTNALACPGTQRIWVVAYSTNGNAGFSWVNLATDSQSQLLQ